MAQRPPPRSPASDVRRQLAQLGHRPRKHLGQHFLSDPGVAARTVALAELQAGDLVVEIGPGLGILTAELAARAAHIFLVEIDAALAARLTERYRHDPRVQVWHEDALEIDFRRRLGEGQRAVAIGNLPYNVATPILAHLLAQRGCFRRFVFMLQQEVAQRLAATPGSRAYGALTVLTRLYTDVRLAFRVSPAAFVPPPRVESAVAVIDVLASPRLDIGDAARFSAAVRAIFQHRRKQLINAARGVLPAPAAAMRAAQIEPTRRPETLSLDEFARLLRAAY